MSMALGASCVVLGTTGFAMSGFTLKHDPPSVELTSPKATFRLREHVAFVVKNGSGTPLHFYCGLETQVAGQWRETATDVRLPFGSKMARVTPLAARGEFRATFQPINALGESDGKATSRSSYRLKCWYRWSIRDGDSEERVVRSRAFDVVP